MFLFRGIQNQTGSLLLTVNNKLLPAGPSTKIVVSQTLLGPKPHLLVDFWRLIWQERPPIIVMVTNLKEGNKKKCEQYWPDNGSMTFGPFKIALKQQQIFADYTIRKMTVVVS